MNSSIFVIVVLRFPLKQLLEHFDMLLKIHFSTWNLASAGRPVSVNLLFLLSARCRQVTFIDRSNEDH
jgi:hypothetical protein